MTNILVQRHELKYYINRSDYEYARALLRELMQHDSHQKSEDGYFIRSVYFDDIYDSSVEEKLAGIENRDKYRLRIYDPDQSWAKLERKRKYNNYVKKSTVIVSKEEAQQILTGTYECLLEKDNSDARSIYYDLKRAYYRPVVTVDYIRDVYMLDYNEIRITFDKQLRSSTEDMSLFSSDVQTEPIQKEEVIIMEVKFNTCLPSWFTDVFRFESATLSAISKYCGSRIKAPEHYQI